MVVNGITAACLGNCSYAASAAATPVVMNVQATASQNGSDRSLAIFGTDFGVHPQHTSVSVADKVQPVCTSNA